MFFDDIAKKAKENHKTLNESGTKRRQARLKLYEDGTMTKEQWAAAFGISESRVKEDLKLLGFKAKPKPQEQRKKRPSLPGSPNRKAMSVLEEEWISPTALELCKRPWRPGAIVCSGGRRQ